MAETESKQVLSPIEKARNTVLEITGNRVKSLKELQEELDCMIAESKKPGYSPDDRKKRQLVINSMETALTVLMNEALNEPTQKEVTAVPVEKNDESVTTVTETDETKSAFEPASDEPEAPQPKTETEQETTWQKILKGIGGFFASIGPKISTWWNRWFKQSETPAPNSDPDPSKQPVADSAPETTVAATGTDDTTKAEHKENYAMPSPSDKKFPPDTAEADTMANPDSETSQATATSPSTNPTDLTPDAPKPEDPQDNTPPAAPEELITKVNLMDGSSHEIAGRSFQWIGTSDKLFTLQEKTFGVGTIPFALITAQMQSMEKKGNGIVIKTPSGRIELDAAQIDSLMNQTSQTTPVTKTGFLGKEYKAIPVTIKYTSVTLTESGETKSPNQTQALDLLPVE